MPKISILTPFKNAEKYIRATAESILAQTECDWEWILVNDHSSENEAEVLNEFLSDKRIRVFTNKGNGIIDALNVAFEQTTGRYCTRMDADDVMPENKLKLFSSYLNSSNPETIVTGKVHYFSEEYEVSEAFRKYESWLNKQVDNNDFYSEIYKECTLASGNWMMHTETLQAIGGFKSLNYPEDYDLLFRWYENKLKVVGLNEITHLWREHSERTSRTHTDYAQESFFQLKVNRLIDLDWNNETIILNGTGQKGRITAKIFIDKSVPFRWFSHEAQKFPNGIYGIKIESPTNFKSEEKILFLNSTLISEEKLVVLYGFDEMKVEMIEL
ncbi:MAG: glycosyltransferase family 2 protein [Fluviicola sp.]